MATAVVIDPNSIPQMGVPQTVAPQMGVLDPRNNPHYKAPPTEASQATDINLNLPNGSQVTMNRPSTATQFVVAKILGADSISNVYMLALVRAIMHIKKINDEPVSRPTTMPNVQLIADRLGDDGLDLVVNCYLDNWAGVKKVDLPLSEA